MQSARPAFTPSDSLRALATLALTLVLSLPLQGLAAPPADPERLLSEGIAHYDMGRFEASLKVLGQAEASTKSPALLARVHLYRGVNLAVLGKTEEARQAFASALQNDPQLQIDSDRFKPEIVSLFRSARSRPPPAATSAPRAEEPAGVLRSGTRPLVASVAVGGASGFRDAVGGFKMVQEIGYHFSRRSSGLALGLLVSEAFGAKDTDALGNSVRVSMFQVGPKLWWDIQPWKRTGFYIAPLLHLGLAYVSASGINRGDSAYAFTVEGGLEAKLVFEDRWLVCLRPFSLNVTVGSDSLDQVGSHSPASGNGVLLHYDAFVGVGAIF